MRNAIFTCMVTLALLIGIVCLFVAAPRAQVNLPLLGVGGGGGAVIPSCSQATNYIAALSSPTVTEQNGIKQLICNAVTHGWWANTFVMYPMLQQTTANAAKEATTAGASFSLVTNGTLTFAADAGYTGDAATGFLNTQWIPNFTAPTCPLNACGVATCITNSRGVTGTFWSDYGSEDSSGRAILGNLYANTLTYRMINDNAFTSSTIASNVKGLWVITRTSSTNISTYQNNSNLVNDTVSSNTVPNANFYIFANDNNNVAQQFSGDTITYLSVGQYSAADAANIYSDVTLYMNTITGHGC
jgi:hypothetical protein